MRRLALLTGALALPLVLPLGSASAATAPTTYVADLDALNSSGASGTATLRLDGTSLTVSIESTGLLAGAPHAQHIHLIDSGDGTCPPPSAAAGSESDNPRDAEFISVPEGAPFYGSIAASLTTSGDTGPSSGLAVDRFPTGPSVTYERTFEVSQDLAANLERGVIVQHGVDVNGNGTYDVDALGVSPLSPEGADVPQEATLPATCGALRAAAAGGADTGFGGTQGVEEPWLFAVGGVALAGAAGLALSRRRATQS